MRHGLFYVAPFAFVAAGIALTVAACGDASPRSGFDPGANDAGAGEGGGGLGGFTDGAVECQGLECKRVECGGGKTTTLSGKVYDPAGRVPLYNVMVYIPGGPNGDAPLPPLKEGAQCQTCASLAINPMVSTLTGSDGSFTLKDVPVADDVPVVVQVGKWRRKLTIDIDKSCEDNQVPDKDFRLPRNGTEGDMPQIAVTTGCDPFECLLRGIGIDDSEFVTGPGGKGHVHVFQGSGGSYSGAPNAETALWNDVNNLMKYDITLLGCECTETLSNKGDGNPNMLGAMVDYLNQGGRMFATHYHYVWFKDSPDGNFKQVALFNGGGSSSSGAYDITTSLVDGSPFPKGQALSEWLDAVGASSSPGKIDLNNLRASISELHTPPSQAWVQKASDVKYFSFNTPLEKPAAEQCGRAVYSDIHLNSGASYPDSVSDCDNGSGDLTPQQRAMEFLFFDLSSCVQADDVPPQPPK